MAGDGDEEFSQGRRGSERHWVRECSPPNTGLLNQRSHLSGVYVRALAPAPAFPLSLSNSSTEKSAPHTKRVSAQGWQMGSSEATSAVGTPAAVPFAGALWVRPGWGTSLWVCRACPDLTGQAALAPREVAGWASECHPGGLHTAT